MILTVLSNYQRFLRMQTFAQKLYSFPKGFGSLKKYSKLGTTGSWNDIQIANCLWLFCDTITHTTVEGTMKKDWLFYAANWKSGRCWELCVIGFSHIKARS